MWTCTYAVPFFLRSKSAIFIFLEENLTAHQAGLVRFNDLPCTLSVLLSSPAHLLASSRTTAHLCTCCDETCACATNGHGHGSRGVISAPTHALPPRRQPGRHAALAGEAIQHVGRAHGRGHTRGHLPAMVRVCGRRPSRGAGGGRDDRRGGCRVQGHPHTLANWRCPRGEPEEQLIAQGLVPIEALEGWPPKQQRQQQEGLVESSAKLHVDDDTGVPHIQGLDFRCATRRAGGRLSRGRSQGRRGSRRGSAGGAGWNGK
jgi:hypothetical protein